ncbi:MAG: Crp/Fnr family transcriptional regulator [Euzebya sp.]
MFRKQPDAKVQRLAEVCLFRAFNDDDLRRVAQRVDETSVEAGKVLATQGQRGQGMYIITAGSAKVERDGKELATLGEGAVIGEMSLIDQQPRTATVTAVESCQLLAMHVADFNALLSDVPGFTRKVLESVVERLREADERLVG